jgi:hypothetical protein
VTVTLPWWTLLLIAAICGIIGWAVTEASHAYRDLVSARPVSDLPDSARDRPASPFGKAGTLLLAGDPYPTVPGSLTSDHYAQLAAYQRDIRQLTAAAEARWPEQWWQAP